MAVLLDANVLIAVLVADHVHHAAAEDWLAGLDNRFATCPITQGALVRLLVREGQRAETARAVIATVAAAEQHEFWPDDVSYAEVPMAGIVGHRQVADGYLAQLARAHRGGLASFDQALARLHADVVELVPTS
jgi:uncharacterized protein